MNNPNERDAAPWEDGAQRNAAPAQYSHTRYSKPAKSGPPRWVWTVIPFVLFLVIGGAVIQIMRGNAASEREEEEKKTAIQMEEQKKEAEALLIGTKEALLEDYTKEKRKKSDTIKDFQQRCIYNQFTSANYKVDEVKERRDDGSGFDMELTAVPQSTAVSRESCSLIVNSRTGVHQIYWK